MSGYNDVRRGPWTLAAIVLVAMCTTILADRIVLENGEVIEGTVIRKTDREITLRSRLGVLSFALDRVSTVRENGKTLTASELRQSLRGDRAERDGELGLPGDLDHRYDELRQNLERTLSEIEASPLTPWALRPKERALGARGQYRVLRPGEEEYEETDDLPEEPGTLSEVWVLERRTGGLTRPESEAVAPTWWVPLYWHPEGRRWLRNHPNESAFNWEDAQVRKALHKVALAAGSQRAARLQRVLGELATEVEPDRQLRWRRILRGTTRTIAGDWGGDELYYELQLATIEIAGAPPAEKVRLGRRRRELLKQLTAMIP